VPTPGDLVLHPLKTTGAFLSVSRMLDAPGPRRKVPPNRPLRLNYSHPSARGLFAAMASRRTPFSYSTPPEAVMRAGAANNDLGPARRWSGRSRGVFLLSAVWRATTGVAWAGPGMGFFITGSDQLQVGWQFSGTTATFVFFNAQDSGTVLASVALSAGNQNTPIWMSTCS
jgi:hypothetical protein